MNFIYIHGMGDQPTGLLEQSLAKVFGQRPGDVLTVLRWGSGSISSMLNRGLAALVASVLVATPKKISDAITGTTAATIKQARRLWREKTASARRVSYEIGRFKNLGTDEDTESITIIAYSLGCQVLVQALAMRPPWVQHIHKIVMVAGAVADAQIAFIPGKLLVEGRIVNVYSPYDAVLQLLYRVVGGEGNPIGTHAVPEPGIQNVALRCQHHQYARHADEIVRLGSRTPDDTLR